MVATIIARGNRLGEPSSIPIQDRLCFTLYSRKWNESISSSTPRKLWENSQADWAFVWKQKSEFEPNFSFVGRLLIRKSMLNSCRPEDKGSKSLWWGRNAQLERSDVEKDKERRGDQFKYFTDSQQRWNVTQGCVESGVSFWFPVPPIFFQER